MNCEQRGLLQLAMEENQGSKTMDTEWYMAAVKGDSTILATATMSGDERTETQVNILHVAVRYEQYNFIEIALAKFPHLVCQRNSDENTPFHIAAEIGNTKILELLVNCYHRAALEGLIPWRVKNSKGNTPLHVALTFAKFQFAEELVIMDPELTTFVNNYKETPLHLAVRYRVTNDDRESVVRAMKLVITSSPGGISIVKSPLKENSEHIITLLLEKNPSVACWRDSNGVTPLLRATLFKAPDISTIGSILKYCPQSIEVCDSSGKTFFHLLTEHLHDDNKKYLHSIEEIIHSLKNRQDSRGNTPAHLAIKSRNIFMVQFLMQVSTNFAIQNEEGVSAADLLLQQSDEFHNLLMNDQGAKLLIPWTKVDEEDTRLVNLLSKLYQRESIHEELRRYDWRGGNVLHKLIDILWDNYAFGNEATTQRPLEDDGVQAFITHALDSCPALICETDRFGKTPLHQIAFSFPDFIEHSVLGMFSHYFKRFEDKHRVEGLYLPPWRMKDKNGNTPLHVAMRWHAPLRCFREFLKLDRHLAVYQNNEKETPLHLLSPVDLSPISFEEVKDLREMVSTACLLYDKNGYTPLLKAAREGNIPLVKLLYLLCPYSVDWKTKNDQKTLWHLLANQTPSGDSKNTSLDLLLEITHSRTAVECLAEADSDGNTPLHLAFEKKNFQFAWFLMEIARDDSRENLMRKKNKKDLTPVDLLGCAEYVPRQFEKFIWRKNELMTILLRAQSLSGVPTALVKESTNTIGVIAALLATITFTGAFTVPGGLNTANGTPILMDRTAFQVFMVSDILAMCLSMMVLFCLLWTMGNQTERVVILDLAIFLLELSFCATLVAFMTGLYVTTYPIASWVAIFACTLCTLLILLMRKRVVSSAIQPVIKIALVSWGVASSVKDFLYMLLCCVPKGEMIGCSQQPNYIQRLKVKLHKHELIKTWRTDTFVTEYCCAECDKPGSDWSFYCKKCNFDLHPECALKNREEAYMPRWIPERSMTCCQQPDENNESGRSSPTRGDAHSEQVDQLSSKWKAAVYPDKKLKLKLHEHELVETWRSAYTCDGCRKPGYNWSFYCERCDFDLHLECALKNNVKAEGECSKEVEATDEGSAKDDESKAEAKEGNTCDL